MGMARNDLCWCGSGKKYKKCHKDFDERISEMKFDVFKGQVRPPKKIINNQADIEGIRRSGVVNDIVNSREFEVLTVNGKFPYHSMRGHYQIYGTSLKN